MRPRVVAIIQARMDSSRLPGKVLQDIAGQPMMARVLARTARASRLDEVLVATTTDASDEAVAAYCLGQNIRCERGSQFDVLDRYYQAARTAAAEIVVRITADCPAIDPQLIDAAVDTLLYGLGGQSTAAPQKDRVLAYDFAANRLPPPFQRTYPIGLDVEACDFGALEQAWEHGHEPQHREHVMPFLYEGVSLSSLNAELATGVSERGFRVALLNHVPDYGSYRWTVDTPSDLEFMRQVYARFDGQDGFSWMDLLQLVHHDRKLAEINAGVRHKTLKDLDERASKR